VADGQTLQ